MIDIKAIKSKWDKAHQSLINLDAKSIIKIANELLPDLYKLIKKIEDQQKLISLASAYYENDEYANLGTLLTKATTEQRGDSWIIKRGDEFLSYDFKQWTDDFNWTHHFETEEQANARLKFINKHL